jgi:hypothetical protein
VSRSRSARSRGAGRTLRDEADHMLHVDLRGHHWAPGEHRLQEGAREPAVVPPRPRAHAAGAEKKPITPAGRRHAGDQVKHSTAFLQWLSGHGLTLSTCRQADIDAWHAEHNEHGRNTIRAFLQWCMTSRLTGRFRLPTPVIRQAAPLPDHERVGQLGYLLTGHDLPLRTRVAAAIVLLYAQPLSRVARLTLDDVIHDGDQVLLRLGEPPSPVPGPIADLLLSWIDNRDNMNTATNRHSLWLFPGRRAGQPMHPDALAALVNHRHPRRRRAGLSDPPARPGDARTRRG